MVRFQFFDKGISKNAQSITIFKETVNRYSTGIQMKCYSGLVRTTIMYMSVKRVDVACTILKVLGIIIVFIFKTKYVVHDIYLYDICQIIHISLPCFHGYCDIHLVNRGMIAHTCINFNVFVFHIILLSL